LIQAVSNAFRVPELRRKILFTIGAVIFFRVLAHVAVPGADKVALDNLFKSNGLLPLIDLFSGGGLARFSITAMGVNPYINASIIMQLMTVVSERMKEMQKEGEYGRKRITQYTRRLTVVLALIQAYGLIVLFTNVNVLNKPSPFTIAVVMVTLTAGTILMMWVGELITEYGIGNGISLIIFAGIVGRFGPGVLGSVGTNAVPIAGLIIFAILAVLVTMFIIYVQQAERRIRIQSAQRMVGRRVYQGRTSHLPLKVNQAGVIPIIFAISIMFFPSILSNFFANSTNHTLAHLATNIQRVWQPTGPSPMWNVIYNATYFFLIIGFTYFYTAVTFDPVDTADNLKKQSIFIPGIRPGRSTAEYLDRVMTRITLVGALFLALITVILPLLAGQLAFGQAASKNNGVLYLGGTAVLIVVGVALDTMKQLETQLLMRQYKGFIK
jgi:preprotein translocase subunit SecY